MIIYLKSKQDVLKLQQISEANGWQSVSLDQKLRRFIDSAPIGVPLTDDDIMNEIREVRQKNKSTVPDNECHIGY